MLLTILIYYLPNNVQNVPEYAGYTWVQYILNNFTVLFLQIKQTFVILHVRFDNKLVIIWSKSKCTFDYLNIFNFTTVFARFDPFDILNKPKILPIFDALQNSF